MFITLLPSWINLCLELILAFHKQYEPLSPLSDHAQPAATDKSTNVVMSHISTTSGEAEQLELQ